MVPNLEVFMQIPNDTGPIYRETIMNRLPVEPFNTFSNLIFLGIIIYFSIKVYKNIRKHTFLAFCIPILTVGFVGGTLFHGTRSHQMWLFMDWVPIMILCISAVFYFVFKLYTIWWKRLIAIFIILGVSFFVRLLPFPPAVRISLGYAVTAVTVLLPIVLYLIKTRCTHKNLIIIAILSFIVAISCRSADKIIQWDWLYMGTHWLWHLFGGISVFFLMLYIYMDQLIINKKVTN